MVRDALFAGLPPPSETSRAPEPSGVRDSNKLARSAVESCAIKPAIKRPVVGNDEEGTKRVRFKTTVEASSEQLVSAMQKISAHIRNPAKFSKASKLALQLLQAGSVSKESADPFFEILKSAMSFPASATEPSCRGDYHELFSAVAEKLDCFSPVQQAQLKVWLLWAQVANDLFTDDTYVFSKAAGRIKQEINTLPEGTAEEDASEAATSSQLDSSSSKSSIEDEKIAHLSSNDGVKEHPVDELENDPFGLNALLPEPSKKQERAKRKKDEAASRRVQEDANRLLRERREVLMECLKIAASRYRLQWAQTIIDILVKHAFDNISRFTAQQRDAIEKLWASIREQHVRRKQGKTASGKLDVTAFERLQDKYSKEKISIRHAVGAGGDRAAEQWLG